MEKKFATKKINILRDRPFNLKGGYGFLFRSEFFFGQHKSWNIYFFCRAKRDLFLTEFIIGLYDKNSESDFFFLHQNQNIFFSNIGIRIFFWKKNITPRSS